MGGVTYSSLGGVVSSLDNIGLPLLNGGRLSGSDDDGLSVDRSVL